MIALFLGSSHPTSQGDAEWTTIGTAKEMNISGLARIEGASTATELLIVHDNKVNGETRLAALTLGGSHAYRVVAWPAGYALPVDLEGVSPVPGRPGVFMTLTSGGTASLLQINAGRATLRGAFTVPDRPGLPSFEGLSVQRVAGVLIAAWGHRGAGPEPGQLWWGRLDVNTPAVTETQSVELRVPFPTESNPDTRHISDMRIARDGRLWVSAASDPGDAGPFQSAIYDVGRFELVEGSIRFTKRATLSPVRTFPRKIEAIELTDDETRMVLGTDDERSGAAVTVIPLP